MQDVHACVPVVEGLDDLTDEQRRAIMMVREGGNQNAAVELTLRQVFVWAIVSTASDIHISGRDRRGSIEVYLHVRTPAGFRNFRFEYPKDEGKHWETKLHQLTGTPQGASTPEVASTRFEMELPRHFAISHNLKPFDDAPGYAVDIRVEYTKTFNGFAFICRLLDAQLAPVLHELGLPYSVYRTILRAIIEPSGLVLVTGPTGSGKTTLLNAILGVLNDETRAIDTIENPVEIALRGNGPIRQRQVSGNITFARALRSILRSDPDVIMVGEIRDSETMEIALQAAQTGHMVLATLHTNNSAETYTRALDLTKDKSRDAYRLAETLKAVISLRRIDRYEGESVVRPLTRDEQLWLAANGIDLGDSVTEVVPTEHKGKVPIVEVIVTTPEVKQLLRAKRVDVSAIYRAACEQDQYEPLAVGGVRTVQSQQTRLRDCISGLEGSSDAKGYPCNRIRYAKEYGLDLVGVANAIDTYHKEADAGSDEPLETYLERARAAVRGELA
ncbi:GspE/PulE family protein [Burkholderia cenocepacia]|uniref:GspE/PulE family protein n=1 Tax=Burkholderia cepacia complex TaxID=87882 RepID=UPI00196A5A86|nr:ATPase, T2SS/T4P/T4SS family [Burkholderia cenocepacia]MBN3506365.1 Flp pilus assembly complex ATPase component TadA [Burkholderia cenocepacia]MBR8173412.1 Flp pilus assembly complex ATPase component TadA [Burkholderia cenocepacia]